MFSRRDLSVCGPTSLIYFVKQLAISRWAAGRMLVHGAQRGLGTSVGTKHPFMCTQGAPKSLPSTPGTAFPAFLPHLGDGGRRDAELWGLQPEMWGGGRR